MNQNKIKIKLDTADKVKKFIQITRSFISDVDIMVDKVCIDGKSILGIYALDLSKDTYVRIISDNIIENRKFDAAMEEFR